MDEINKNKKIDMTHNKIKLLCNLIGGVIKIPEDTAYQHNRCVVDEKKLYSGNEKESPFLFHNINRILDSTRYLNEIIEQVNDKKKEHAKELEKDIKDIEEYKKEINENSSTIYEDSIIKSKYMDDKSEKATQIIKILDSNVK